MPIRKLVSQGRLSEALKMLEPLVKQQNDADWFNIYIMLSADWNRLKHAEIIGMLSYEQNLVSRARITKNLLQLLDIIESNKHTSSTNSSANNAFKKGSEVKEVNKNIKNIVMLTANPAKTAQLKLKDEYYMIQQSVQHYKDKFAVYSDDQVTPATMLKAATHPERAPWCLHFSGHGEQGDPKIRKMLEDARRNSAESKTYVDDGSGLVVASEDRRTFQIMSSNALNAVFKTLKRNVPSLEVVVLNACYSQVQAEVISKHGFYVIGAANKIKDSACRAFSDLFYDTIAKGGDFIKAVDYGRVNAMSYGLDDENEINLFHNGKNVDI